MRELPEQIYAWWFHADKRSDVISGGWHTAPDRGETACVRADIHAAQIAALQARVAELEAGLSPFAQEHAWGPDTRFEIVVAGQTGSVTGADLDRARALLAKPTGDRT